MTATVEVPDLGDIYDVPGDDEGRKAWTVDSLAKATWAMQRARDLALRQKEIRDVANDRIEQLEAWAQAEVTKLDRDRDFFQDSVAAYALRLRAEDPKRKSLVTPFGTVRTQERSGSWTINGPAVLAWAKQHRPEFVKTEEQFCLGEAKKAFVITEAGVLDPVTGTLVEGVTPGETRITALVDIDMTKETS